MVSNSSLHFFPALEPCPQALPSLRLQHREPLTMGSLDRMFAMKNLGTDTLSKNVEQVEQGYGCQFGNRICAQRRSKGLMQDKKKLDS